MSCKNICRLCPNLIISESLVFTAGTGLIINIPEGSYRERCRYCIVVAQAIPDATTINSLVYITIGDGTELYPLNQCDGAQVTANQLRTRTKYSTRVSTTATGGSFNLLGKICGQLNNGLTAIDGTAPVADGGAGA